MPNNKIIIPSSDASQDPVENPLDAMLKDSGVDVDLSGAFDWSQGPTTPVSKTQKQDETKTSTPAQKTIVVKQITKGDLPQQCEHLHALVNSSKQKTTEYKQKQKTKMHESIDYLYEELEKGNVHDGVKKFVEEINGMIDEWKRDGKVMISISGAKLPVVNNYYKDLFIPNMHSHLKLLHNLKDGARMMELSFLRINEPKKDKLKAVIENLVSDYLKELKQIVEEDHALSQRKKTPLAFLSAIVPRKAKEPLRLLDSDINKRVDDLFKKTPYGIELAQFAKAIDVDIGSRIDSKQSLLQQHQISAPGKKI